MSLWEDYLAESGDVLIEGVPDSISDSIYSWLNEIGHNMSASAYNVAQHIKNKFRINSAIPNRRPNNYLDPGPEWKFTNFLFDIAKSDPELFFVIIDYLMSKGIIQNHLVKKFASILNVANHQYKIEKQEQGYSLVERIPKLDQELMRNALDGKQVYSSEFRDAYQELYGMNHNYTNAAHEAFQSLESALKYYIGEDKGDNLGRMKGWLNDNKEKWSYSNPSDGQEDAEEHFIKLIDFVNKSYRGIKHGHANKKLFIEKEHAETILRVVAIIIFELENIIKINPN